MKNVTLKTGQSVPQATVSTTMLALRSLADGGSLALFELVELCKNSKHQLWNDTVKKELKELSLIQPGGYIHDDVKAIVASAVEGEGLNMKLVSPLFLEGER